MSIYTKHLLLKYKKEVVINIFLSVIVMLLTIACPIALKEYISSDNGLGDKKIFALYIVTLLFSYLMMLILKVYDLKVGYGFKVSESINILDKIFHMDYMELIKKEPTYLIEKLSSSVDTIYLLFSKAFSGFFVSAITIAVSLFLIARINLVLFALFLALIPIFKILPQKLNKNLSSKSEQLQTISAKNNTFLKCIVSTPDAFKQIGDVCGIMGMASERVKEVQNEKYSINLFAGTYSLFIDFCMVLLTNLINIYSVYLFSNNMIEISSMVFVNLISGIYITALTNAINLDITIIDLKGALSYIDKEVIELQEKDGTERIERIDSIEVNVKQFGYDKILIKDAHLKLTRGENIGLCGESGGGKSTLLKMLLKYIESEDILVNSIPIKNICNSDIRKKISYVSQSVYLFPGSILDNITVGQEFDSIKLNEIINMPFLKKFYDLPEKLETPIIENGANLSGGDKQRIIIARALLKQADIYIFDEAFSALDEKTAVDLETNIITEYKDSSIIIVSHNPRLLEQIEKRYLLEDGVLRIL